LYRKNKLPILAGIAVHDRLPALLIEGEKGHHGLGS
jgi:hypothetical protein